MRKSRRKRRRRRRTRRGGGKKGKKAKKAKKDPLAWQYLPENNNLADGELSVEKTIEGQQLRDDGGGAGQAADLLRYEKAGLFGPPRPKKKDTYYHSQGFSAIGDADDELSPEMSRELREKRRHEKARRRLGLGDSAQDDVTRLSLVADAAAGRGSVSRDNAEALGFDAISPVPDWSAEEIARLEEDEAAAEMIVSERSAAAAIKDKKVLAAADRAAAEHSTEIAAASAKADAEGVDPEKYPATGGISPLFNDENTAGGRRSRKRRRKRRRTRKRRRKRRRTRKKRGGYGPITTGGWFPHNLLLPSQHLGSLGMWWTGGRR